MVRDSPRWRFRISTVMLLVIILALAIALIRQHVTGQQEWRRLEAAMRMALEDAAQSRAMAERDRKKLEQAEREASARGQRSQ
jgi:uncharacterized membrane protein (DUF106 family)